MKLGISIGYFGGQVELPVERVLEGERLGYDSVWTAAPMRGRTATAYALIRSALPSLLASRKCKPL